MGAPLSDPDVLAACQAQQCQPPMSARRIVRKGRQIALWTLTGCRLVTMAVAWLYPIGHCATSSSSRNGGGARMTATDPASRRQGAATFVRSHSTTAGAPPARRKRRSISSDPARGVWAITLGRVRTGAVEGEVNGCGRSRQGTPRDDCSIGSPIQAPARRIHPGPGRQEPRATHLVRCAPTHWLGVHE